nr:TonB-dependent receptor [Ramlibacter alkalitolerans]
MPLLGGPAVAQGQGERESTLPEVRVIPRTPLPGFETPRALYPGNAQQASDLEIERAGAPNLPEFMNRRLPGVIVNEVQGSPYQVDLTYRGQRLSPLLGTAQGLSLWLDGVRLNQPFGDVANWDLLPESAIAGLALVPGSNPLYGLNTLGGALVLTTKSGLTHEGTEADVSVGSAGRHRIGVGHGRRFADGWHAYVAASAFEERGWRDFSRGSLANLFVKAGRQQGEDGWSATLLDAGSRLNGNGLVPEPLFQADRSAIYTAPDASRNHDTLVSLQATRGLPGAARLVVQGWWRHGRRHGSTGDVSDEEDADALEAAINTTRSRQSEAGLGVQWSQRRGAHQWVLGADAAVARISHDQFDQPGTFDARRFAIASPADEPEHEVALRGRTRRFGLFAGDTYEIRPGTQLSLSARWGSTRVRNALGQPEPLLPESFTYRKLNPALGITHALDARTTLFASASQGNRVPTALELGCADAERPCVLPTGLQADPFLQQVVARTYEIGARVQPAGGPSFSGALFRTDTRNDIVFLRSGLSQAGFFANVDRTRRQGAELSAQGRNGALEWQAAYTFLDATYRSPLVLSGPLSTEEQPNAVRSGDRIAGLPRQVLKLSADWTVRPRLTVGADWLVAASQTVAGNEGGSRPELGRLGGYAVLHARLRWQFTERWQAYLRVHNVFDRRYATFAAGSLDLFPGGAPLAPGAEAAPERFLAPGAPRLAVVGLRYVWD